MTEELIKYLTADEHELLELVPYQLKYLADVKRKQGSLHPQDEQAQKELGTIDSILSQTAQYRKTREDEKNNLKSEKQEPIACTCPTCNIIEARKPTGIKKIKSGNKKNTYTCNRYYCTHCQSLFVDYMPNNTKDQLSWYENFIDKMENEYADKFLTTPKEKQSFEVTKAGYENLKKHYTEREEKIRAVQALDKKLKAHEALYKKAIASWRNQLLVAKVKLQWIGTSKMGSS